MPASKGRDCGARRSTSHKDTEANASTREEDNDAVRYCVRSAGREGGQEGDFLGFPCFAFISPC